MYVYCSHLFKMHPNFSEHFLVTNYFNTQQSKIFHVCEYLNPSPKGQQVF